MRSARSSGALVLGTAALLLCSSSALAADPSDEALGSADRGRIARAEARGDDTVTLLIAAQPGKADQVADGLRALGATVEKKATRIDYVKAEVPVGRAEKAADLKGITAVDVDGLTPFDDPKPEGQQDPLPQTPPSAATPRVNPYLPTGDTGAAQFATKHPTWDGRGTTIAIIDSGVDLANPSLNTTSTGERKIIDWYDANAPDSGDGSWVPVTGAFTGFFTAAGSTWQAPATGGPYAFGRFVENAGDLAGGELGGDIDRDGVTGETFGVLQDSTSKQVYVDVDADHNFTNDPAMTDYKVNFDQRQFGRDNPATAIAEAMPFVVQTDKPGYVDIGIVAAEHGSHVAGIAAGNQLFGGAMSGAAPGAKVLAIKVCLTAGCTNSGLIDGPLYAAQHGADVANISIGGLPALNDGNNARAVLYNRIIDEFDMQLVISAGNSGSGANTVGDPAVATDSIAVGASITKATWLSNYGSVATKAFSLMPFSSRGPREDGGMKPDVVAPGSAISTTPTWQPGGPVAGTFNLPPGYSMLNGTSMAAPQTAGAAALLISAYKATHSGAPRPDAAELRNAIRTTADFKSGIQAYEQGRGEVNVASAWTQLSTKKVVVPYAITATVPVNTLLSGFLATPAVGTGIHDREGVAPGQKYTRTYTLTRTTGPAKPVAFTVRWIGDTKAFTSAGTVTLPLNQAVSFPVKIDAATAGIHSAVLEINSRDTTGTDLITLNTVVASVQLGSATPSLTFSGTVARNDTQHFFVRVPPNTPVLRVALQGGGSTPGAGQLRFLRVHPYGVMLEPEGSTICYDPPVPGGSCPGSPTSRDVVNPVAGVWEVIVESRRTSDAATSPFTLTVNALSATVSPNPDTIASATLGVPIARSYTVTNTGAAFTGRLRGAPLDSTKLATPTIADAAQQQFQISVPAGATQLRAKIGGAADPTADLDLFLFNCTSGSCIQAAASAGSTADEAVTVNNPAAGVWVVLVDGFAVPGGTTTYHYEDMIASTQFGNVTVTDADALRPPGAIWTVPGVVTAQATPAAGRVLSADIPVITDGGTTIGSGRVIVQSVS